MWEKVFSRDVHAGEVLLFIGIFHYMGIVLITCKKDYWATHEYLPPHKIFLEFGMTRDHFCFLWRHFHMVELDGTEVEEFTEEDEEDVFEWDYARREEGQILTQDEYDDKKRHWFFKV